MTAAGEGAVPPALPVPVAPERTLDGALGLQGVELGPESLQASFDVVDRHRQRFGIVHGGTYAACAEALASEATNAEVAASGRIGVGLSNATSFLRPIVSGRVTISGRALHRGRTTHVWDVEFLDAQGRRCATSRVTVAVVAAPAAG
jgi:1,4-dihydroxy-2-naphthoyl-CoA hydrolase